MRHAAVSLSLVAALAAVAACQAPSSTGAKIPTETRTGGTSSTSKLGYEAGMVTGRVFAPAGVVAGGGANVVAAGGANAVASGGANYRALTVTETMLAGAEVFIADAGGKPIPGLKHVKTDTQGHFSIPEVPAGYSFLVVARILTAKGDDGTLKTLARVTKLGTTVELGTASTLVATAAVEGQSDALGSYNVASYERAVQTTAKALGPDDVPDFADAGAVLQAFGKLEARVGELESVVDQLKGDIARVEGELDKLKEQLENNAGASTAPASAAPSPRSSAATTSPTPTITVSVGTNATAPPTASPTSSAATVYNVTTLAGAGESVKGFADGVGTAAQFNGPRGLTLDTAGNVYVADTNNFRVRKITPDGTVTTYAGQSAQGVTDGALGVGKLSAPIDVACLDASGRLAVTDGSTQRIRLVAADGTLSTLAGGGGAGTIDGVGSAAKFRNPRGLSLSGSTLYVADLGDPDNSRVRKVGLDGTVTTVSDGAGGLSLPGITDVAVDEKSGAMIVAQPTLDRVVKVTPAGAVTALAGTGTANALKAPTGVALASDGTIFIADTDNNRICRLAPNGTMTVIAGGTVGYADGAGAVAQFKEPFDIEVGLGGKIYVSEKSGQRVRVLTPASD